jgi:hypothetical protein
MSKGKPAGIKTPPDGSLRSEVDGFPLAVPSLELAAQLLARPLPTVENAAKKVEPYRHRDGHPVWSLRELPWPLAWSSRTQRPAPSKGTGHASRGASHHGGGQGGRDPALGVALLLFNACVCASVVAAPCTTR